MSSQQDQFWIGEPDATGRRRLGISEGWLDQLGGGEAAEVLGLDLAAAGTAVRAGETFGFIYLPSKTVDLRAPLALRVASRNESALADPRLVSLSPSLRGWLIEIVPLAADTD